MTCPTSSQGPAVDRPRLLIIGLDGATYDVLLPMMDAGLLPNLTAIADQGVRAVLNSTIPPLSGPAWVTFLTGKSSGKHGVFHFFQRGKRGQNYSMALVVNGASIRTFTLWDWLSRLGYRIISINVPMTYPPRSVNGLLITGMMTPPGAQNFTHPPDLVTSLVDYRVDLDYFAGEQQFDWRHRPKSAQILADLTELLISRCDTSLQLMQKGEVARYALRLFPPDLPHTVTLTVTSPSPDLVAALSSIVVAPGAAVTLTVTDVGSTLLPGVWYTVPITGTGGGFTQTASVRLLYHGEQIYLPLIFNDSPTVLGQATALTATVAAGSNVAYTWAFGDGSTISEATPTTGGTTGSGAVVTHTYPAIGTYTAVVTASNSVSVLTTTTSVTVTPAPAPYTKLPIYLPLILK